MTTALPRLLADLDPHHNAARSMQVLVTGGLDRLPPPGGGQTLQRWQALSAVAAHDLSLAKLFEGHTDALATFDELSHPRPVPPASVWGMWAAEAPGARVLIQPDAAAGVEQVRLNGVKHWCSGAASVSHGLLTAWHADGRGPQLVAVSMRQPGIGVHSESWQAVGMKDSASIDVAFDGVHAELVGQPGAYLSRAGFWQGGAGIAACWHGGATYLGSVLQRALAKARARLADPPPPSFRQAALGRIDMELTATAALLREAARWIDLHPRHDASDLALRVRLRAECAAKVVLDAAGSALGAAPFCRDARFARMAADLPVFIRQSHGERDFAALGERLAAGATDGAGWPDMTTPRQKLHTAEDFDSMYSGTDDPWHFKTRWYEQRKRGLTLACLPAARFASAYEPGCANGELSIALAPRCDRLLISDGSPKAVHVARERTGHLCHVEVRQAWLPDEWPDEQFDLIVVSELGYYLDVSSLDRLAERMRASLLPRGTLLACHWGEPIEGCALSGDDIHRRLARRLALPPLCSYSDGDLRLDVWSRDERSVAEREGFKLPRA